MFQKLTIVAAISLIALPAFAVDKADVKESFPLKDGSTVYIFKDGKMGMEDKRGRASFMRQGHSMETMDGKKIMMIGNEVVRVERILGVVAPSE